MHDVWRRDGEVWKGAVAGIAGGLVASWVMNRFHEVARELGKEASEKELSSRREESLEPEGEDATVKTAERISRALFDHELQEKEKEIAGPAVHYAMGAVTGGLYGAAAEVVPLVTRGAGLPFGAAVWLAADEVAVPALGLSQAPRKTPASIHAREFGAHLVYGLTTDLVRRALRRVL